MWNDNLYQSIHVSYFRPPEQWFANFLLGDRLCSSPINHGSSLPFHINTDCPGDRSSKLDICISGPISDSYQYIQGDTKKRELLKTHQKMKKSKKNNLLTEIEPLQLAF